MLTIHCSALARALACPQSLVPPQVAVETESEAASIGSAVHECLAAKVLGIDVDIDAVARTWGAEPAQVGPLVYAGLRMWEQYDLRANEVEHMLSAFVGSVELVGTTDVAGENRNDGLPFTLDWKSGVPQESDKAQCMGYRFLQGSPGYGIIVYLRENLIEVFEITEADFEALERDIRELPSRLDEPYHPSFEACRFCPRAHECPGRSAYLDGAVGALIPANEVLALTPQRLANLRPKAALLQQALDNYNARLREVLASGPIDLGDGTEMALEGQKRESVNAQAILRPKEAGCQALAESIGALPQEVGILFADAFSVSKSKLLDEVGKRAVRGHKGKVKDALMAQLRAAGAVEEKEIQLVRVRPAQKELPEGEGQ